MKKILLGSITLFLFSSSIVLFQISCQKSAVAQTGGSTSTQLNKIVVGKHYMGTGTSPANFEGFYIMSYEGTSVQKINPSLPAGLSIDNVQLSPNGTTVFLTVVDNTFSCCQYYVYTCDINGGNLKKIVDDGLKGHQYYQVTGTY